MTVPSQMSLRRIPDALHLPVRVAYAMSWEALIDTHTRQAVQFVTEFAPRISVLRGLDLKTIPEPAELPLLTGWHRLRLDLQLEHHRYRRRHQERTLELATMAGSRAAEAVVATHVENALELTWLLKGVIPVNAAADHYIREFGLSAGVAQMVLQRVQARLASDELTAPGDDPLPPVPEPTAVSEEAPGFAQPATGGL